MNSVTVSGFPALLFDRLAFSIPAFAVAPVLTQTKRVLEVARIFTKHLKYCDEFFRADNVILRFYFTTL